LEPHRRRPPVPQPRRTCLAGEHRHPPLLLSIGSRS
jgi:hypothetical protein